MMVDGFKDMLLNLLFIIAPLFLYHLLQSGYRPKRFWYYALLLMLPACSAVLCMSFPLYIAPGYFFSMAGVPFILAFLYGGVPGGAATCVVGLAYRFWLGGEGFWLMLGTVGLTSMLLLGILPLFRNMSSNLKIAVVGICAIAYRSILAFVNFALEPDLFYSMLDDGSFMQLSVVMTAVSLLSAYVIELIHRQSNSREAEMNTEKLKMISELAASVSHEVRNPLTVTQGFIQLLRQPGIDPEKQERYLQLALEELRRAQSIITDFLSFAKPQMEHIELIEIEGEMQYVIGVMYPYALMQNVLIQYEPSAGSYWIKGDRQKLRQCLINLMKNSVEAMPDGGTLFLRVQAVESYVQLRIEDTGIGMDDEQLKRLGKPYYSTKDKGTGLGTMVVFRIIEAMGGSVSVQSEKGRGTVFTILLPLDKSDPAISLKSPASRA